MYLRREPGRNRHMVRAAPPTARTLPVAVSTASRAQESEQLAQVGRRAVRRGRWAVLEDVASDDGFLYTERL